MQLRHALFSLLSMRVIGENRDKKRDIKRRGMKGERKTLRSMPYMELNSLESIMGVEEIYSPTALSCTPSTLIKLAFRAFLYSRSMPCLTASRTLSTVAFGANRGLVPS